MPESSSSEWGKLYVVATPIGNMADMVPRAIETLQTVDLIAAEDTRHSAKLLQNFGITTPMQAYHDHNERTKVGFLIEKLLAGTNIALISDAGTPLISDPGYHIVHAARSKGITVSPIPGPAAFVAALSASGLPADRFRFEGFLPAKSSQRIKALDAFKASPITTIFYESSHRIVDALADVAHSLGEQRTVVVAREVTKRFETFLTGTCAQVRAQIEADDYQRKGEFVLMIAGVETQNDTSDPISDSTKTLIELLLAEGLSLKRSVAIAAKHTGERKNVLYDWAVAQKKFT